MEALFEEAAAAAVHEVMARPSIVDVAGHKEIDVLLDSQSSEEWSARRPGR
jgi:hypothetical protein